MTTHTPGPWFHNRTVSPARAVWNTRGARGPEDGPEILICPSEAEVDANMQVIAAVPELLAALEKIAELEDDCEHQKFKLTRFQASQIARAALLKARAP